MTKDEIEFILKHNSYLKGGTKESAIKVKEFIKQIESIESSSSIDYKEFLESINTLLAFSFSSMDTVPDKWHCENDCKYSGFLLCAGEFNTDDKSEKICPYYVPEM
jgi:hypothetical protein